jgi:hypothetical protein
LWAFLLVLSADTAQDVLATDAHKGLCYELTNSRDSHSTGSIQPWASVPEVIDIVMDTMHVGSGAKIRGDGEGMNRERAFDVRVLVILQTRPAAIRQ